MYTYVRMDGEEEEHVALDLRSGFGRGFYYPTLGNAGKPGWEHNPYEGAALNAPFDQVRGGLLRGKLNEDGWLKSRLLPCHGFVPVRRNST